MKVLVKKLHEDAVVPSFAHIGDAGADLYSIEDVEIYPSDTKMISTGIAIQLPPQTEAQIRPRSGLAAKHGITVLNSPGTIDVQYIGEIKILLHNTSNVMFKVEKGMRIAQMVINKLPLIEYIETDKLSDTIRGKNGFGSTGVK